MQHANGAGKLIYWISTLAWDLLLYCLTILGSLIILLSSRPDDYAHVDAAFYLLLLYFLYGLTAFALTYILSLFFKKHFLAQGTSS